MVDVDAAFDTAGLKNAHVREYVRYWVELTGSERVEVISASDDARLVDESLAAGEILPVGDGAYYSRSYVKDTARSEERTIVATNNPADKGVYNNWRPGRRDASAARGADARRLGGQDDVRGALSDGAARLAARAYAAGVELTDHRTVVLHMIRMARVGADYIDNLTDPNASSAASTSPATSRTSARARPTTSATSSPSPTSAPSCTSARPTAATRCSARSPTACARPPTTAGRRASSSPSSSCSSASPTSRPGRLPRLRRLPERVRQDQPRHDAGPGRARRPLPRRVLRRRHRLAARRSEADGKIYAINPEFGVFGVAKDTNESTNPNAIDAIGPGTGTLFTNVAYNENTHEVWWEGRTPDYPRRRHRLARLEGPADQRPPGRQAALQGRRRRVGAPQQPLHHDAGQRAQHRRRLREPEGRADRRDHLRRPNPRPRAAGSAPSPTSPRASTTASRSAPRPRSPPRARTAYCATTRCRCGRSCPTPRARTPRTG